MDAMISTDHENTMVRQCLSEKKIINYKDELSILKEKSRRSEKVNRKNWICSISAFPSGKDQEI
jgi:hypothetical protein